MARKGKAKPVKVNSAILGAAGEHYVMCQLLRRERIAALAPAGVPNADLIVTDKIGDKMCAVQVKTRRDIGSDRGWHMGEKHEAIVAPNLFYCFVDLGQALEDHPKCWIVPSAVVAKALNASHQKWLSTPGKKGQQRKDNNLRRFTPSYDYLGLGPEFSSGWLDPYRDAWSLLDRAAGPPLSPTG
jgi:hypothetical protein